MKEVIESLRNAREYAHSIKTDDLLEYLEKVGEKIGIKEIKKFISKDNLKLMMDIALRGNYRVLDEFMTLKDGRLYHAQPRGLAVHWVAGNVENLGIYSIIQAMITKNVSLVRTSSSSYQGLKKLLDNFSAVNTNKINGKEFSKTFALVLVDSKDKEKNEEMSKAADIRIAWGGYEAIEAITNYKKNIFCEDIVYGPKYSYAVVDKENANSDSARKLAFDISTFDQTACSSPHTIFVEERALDFAKLLAQELDKVNRLMIPKGHTEPGKKMEILSARAEGIIKGQVFSSENTDWTVIYSEEIGLAQPCFSRVAFVKPLKDLNLKGLNTRHQQTVGLAMKNNSREDFVDNLTMFGADRCPKVGEMTLFGSPWDGMFAIDRMVRWIVTWK
ncbi:MAG: acyl-CoA reductase [Nanoarchaeota archaeon]